MKSSRNNGVEVSLRIRRVPEGVSGQRTLPAGLVWSSSNISPLMSNRSPCRTGVETAEKPGLPPETVGSRQYTAPLVGFKELTDSRIQTMSWRLPPAEMITGELQVADSLNARQTSRPVERSKATTPA